MEEREDEEKYTEKMYLFLFVHISRPFLGLDSSHCNSQLLLSLPGRGRKSVG
jgi:hypothetical protein